MAAAIAPLSVDPYAKYARPAQADPYAKYARSPGRGGNAPLPPAPKLVNASGWGSRNDLTDPGLAEAMSVARNSPDIAIPGPENPYGKAVVDNLSSGASDIHSGEYSRGAHKIITGAGIAASPLLPLSLLSAPIGTAIALGSGVLGSSVGSHVANAFGATPDQSDLVGDVVGLPAAMLGGAASESPALRATTSAARTMALKRIPGLEDALQKPWAGPTLRSVMDWLTPSPAPAPPRTPLWLNSPGPSINQSVPFEPIPATVTPRGATPGGPHNVPPGPGEPGGPPPPSLKRSGMLPVWANVRESQIVAPGLIDPIPATATPRGAKVPSIEDRIARASVPPVPTVKINVDGPNGIETHEVPANAIKTPPPPVGPSARAVALTKGAAAQPSTNPLTSPVGMPAPTQAELFKAPAIESVPAAPTPLETQLRASLPPEVAARVAPASAAAPFANPLESTLIPQPLMIPQTAGTRSVPLHFGGSGSTNEFIRDSEGSWLTRSKADPQSVWEKIPAHMDELIGRLNTGLTNGKLSSVDTTQSSTPVPYNPKLSKSGNLTTLPPPPLGSQVLSPAQVEKVAGRLGISPTIAQAIPAQELIDMGREDVSPAASAQPSGLLQNLMKTVQSSADKNAETIAEHAGGIGHTLTTNKNAAMAQHLLGQGIDAEKWSTLPLDEKQAWVKKINAATKSKYKPFGADFRPGGYGRPAEEGARQVEDALRVLGVKPPQ